MNSHSEKIEMLDKFQKHHHSSERELAELFKILKHSINKEEELRRNYAHTQLPALLGDSEQKVRTKWRLV